MDRFRSIEAFVMVAKTGSFSEAARRLGVAASVVTQRVQQLEQLINTPLFHRTTRHVRLSEVGATFYKESAELIARVLSLTEQMQQLRSVPTGKLSMQMLPGFAIDYFGPLLGEFSVRYPGIKIDVTVNDQICDPIEEGFDVTFQIFPPLSETLVTRRLVIIRRLFCATRAYLDVHGVPASPVELQKHVTALYSGYPSRRNLWLFKRGDEAVEVNLLGHLRSNSVHLLRDFALANAGIVCLPTMVASRELLEQRLVPVLTDWTLSHFNFIAVYPTTQRQGLKVRLLIDFLAAQFEGDPYWDKPLLERGWLSCSD